MVKERVVAALGIGPYSVLMLLAKFTGDGRIVPLNEFVAVTKLIDGLDASCSLSDAAIAKTVQAAKELQGIAFKEGASNLLVAVGSFVRAVDNRSKFLLKCHQSLSLYPKLLSGKDEARLAFLGASSELPDGSPLLMLAVGSLSTQMAYGSGGRIDMASDLPIGAAEFERQFSIGSANSLMRRRSALAKARDAAMPLLQGFEEWTKSLASPPTLLLTGPISNCYAAVAKGQRIYELKELNMSESSRAELLSAMNSIGRVKPKDRPAIPGMEPELAEIMPAGLLIISSLIASFNLDKFKVTSSGLLAGLLRYFIQAP